MVYNSLQLREIFHLEFLRRLGRSVKPGRYALKGGANLRFFFGSLRYSEDMDFDVKDIEVFFLSDTVMKIISAPSFGDYLMPFGIESITAPDIAKAKQTLTTQRFKIHLKTEAGEDLFTRVEFSRRGFTGKAVVQPVSSEVLRNYGVAPLLASHYDADSAAVQKVKALAGRKILQARDVFDLFMLSSRKIDAKSGKNAVRKVDLERAYDNVFGVNYEQFRDTVIAYLSSEDQESFGSEEVFDAVRVRAAEFIKEMSRESHE